MKLILEQRVGRPEHTTALAQKIWSEILAPCTNFSVALEGGLGAGKTFLVREILHAAGITGAVPSPTYTLVSEYGAEGRQFAHFDFYRLEDPDEFFARGFAEIAEDEKVSMFFEWPEKISDTTRRAFTGQPYIIRIEHGASAGLRRIRIFDPLQK